MSFLFSLMTGPELINTHYFHFYSKAGQNNSILKYAISGASFDISVDQSTLVRFKVIRIFSINIL